MALLPAPAYAERKWHRLSPELVEKFKGRVKVGMEIELNGRFLQRLIPDFDFDEYQARDPGVLKRIPVEIVDRYVDQPANFDSLPEDVRKRLTKDLKYFNSVKILAPGSELPDRNALEAGQTRTQGGLLIDSRIGDLIRTAIPSGPMRPPAIPPRGILLSPDHRASAMVKEGDLFVSSDNNTLVQRDWIEIRKRWTQTPLDQRLSLIKISRMDRADIETLLLLRDGWEVIDIPLLRLKGELPANARRIYENLEWVRDQGSIEFRHQKYKPLEDPNAYLDEVEAFAQRAGIWERLANPTQGMLESYHAHQSVLGVQGAEQRLRALNVTRFIDGLDAGFEGVLDKTVVSYFSVAVRGLYRMIDPERVESRFHLRDPGTELELTLRSMTEENFAYDNLQKSLDEKLNVKNLHLILTQKEGDKLDWLLRDLSELSDDLPRKGGNIERLVRLLPEAFQGIESWKQETLLGKLASSSKLGPAAAGIAAGMDALVPDGLLELFYEKFIHSSASKSASSDPLLARFLELGDVKMKQKVLTRLQIHFRSWGEPLRRQVLELSKSSEPQLAQEARKLLDLPSQSVAGCVVRELGEKFRDSR